MSNPDAMILLVDDDPDDQDIVAEALEEAGSTARLKILPDGQELLDFLFGNGAYAAIPAAERIPSLILLDINMPRKNGIDALAQIKNDESLRLLPVVMLTTSRSEEDVVRSYQLGCNSFVTKPGMFDTLVDLMQTLNDYWLNCVQRPDTQRLIDQALARSSAQQD